MADLQYYYDDSYIEWLALEEEVLEEDEPEDEDTKIVFSGFDKPDSDTFTMTYYDPSGYCEHKIRVVNDYGFYSYHDCTSYGDRGCHIDSYLPPGLLKIVLAEFNSKHLEDGFSIAHNHGDHMRQYDRGKRSISVNIPGVEVEPWSVDDYTNYLFEFEGVEEVPQVISEPTPYVPVNNKMVRWKKTLLSFSDGPVDYELNVGRFMQWIEEKHEWWDCSMVDHYRLASDVVDTVIKMAGQGDTKRAMEYGISHSKQICTIEYLPGVTLIKTIKT